ncbi:MAG: peptide chain release factor 1 [Dehalococcoidales bacterium]|nr:peptide chain release factor 1 [Dehalococcoidales bacterium]
MMIIDTLTSIERRYEELNRLMGQPEVATDVEALQNYAREQSSLQGTVQKFREYKEVAKNLEQAKELLDDGETDPELRQLAEEEVSSLEEQQEHLLEEIKFALLPADPDEERNCIVEIRSAAGGDEAALFAADLYRMYARYAERKGWKTEVIDANITGLDGFKEIIFQVKGRGAYSRLRYESGVHRVQRVPVTEAGGRIHTSTATVAVLPEVEEVDVQINPDDLKIDTFCSSGAGGQNVNKVATAVRVTYIPTGMVITCQDERSQLKNKIKALSVLRARLYEQEASKRNAAIDEARRLQVGAGDRSEKIRTYNFPQDRVTDHRIGFTAHRLEAILDGDIDDMMEALATQSRSKQLQAVGLAS